MFLHPEKRLEEDDRAPYLTAQLLDVLLFCLHVALSFYTFFVELFRHRSVVR